MATLVERKNERGENHNYGPQIVKERRKIDNANVELGITIDKWKQALEQ